jgi:hypothetical protein
VRSYREKGKVNQEVVHLGEHETAQAALAARPQEIKWMRRMGRPKKAETRQRKLDKLQELNEGGMRCFQLPLFTEVSGETVRKGSRVVCGPPI